MKRDMTWPVLSEQCVLKSFPRQAMESWEEYLKTQREYWGEDRISGSRSDMWEWKGSEAKWLERTKEDYADYLTYNSTWHGLFREGDTIPVVQTEKKNVIKLCRATNGKTTWGETLELWLYKDINFFPPKQQLRCEIIGFSTATNDCGDPTWSRKHEDCVVHVDRSAKVMLLGQTLFDLS